MSVERVKHNPVCFESEKKWTYSAMTKEDYQRKEQARKVDTSIKTLVVYDIQEKSPFYTDKDEPYIDEKKLLNSKTNNGFIQPRVKQRGFRRPLINSGIPK